MNYSKVYTNLINRSQIRTTSNNEYYELHHIIPRCMQGKDVKDNIVRLTAREHYVAHQLLVKMYPGNSKLIYAANMMTVNTADLKRSKNKRYEWLRKRFAVTCSIRQQGKGNTSYGSIWVTNYEAKQCKRIDKIELDSYVEQGWIQERKINFDTGKRLQAFKCQQCQSSFSKKTAAVIKFCSTKCRQDHAYFNGGTYQLFTSNLESIKQWHAAGSSLNIICKNLGLPGAQGAYFVLLKRFMKEKYPVPDSN